MVVALNELIVLLRFVVQCERMNLGTLIRFEPVEMILLSLFIFWVNFKCFN